jgi:hypothetical protein
MAGRNSRVLPGNGILSGLALDTGAPNPDDPIAYESPWAKAVREAWEKQLRDGRDSSSFATLYGSSEPIFGGATVGDTRWSPFAPNANLLSGQSSWSPFLPPANIPSTWPLQPTSAFEPSHPPAGTVMGASARSQFAGSPYLNSSAQAAPRSDVVPASYRDGGATRPWWTPVSPGNVFDPWAQDAIESLRKTIAHFRQGGGSTTSGGDRNPTSSFEPSHPPADAVIGGSARSQFAGSPYLNSPAQAVPGSDVVPVSYRDGATRPWGTPVTPGDVFDPWVQGAIESLRKTIAHFRQGGGSTTSDGDYNSPDCDEEWKDARALCASELAKPNPSRAVTGGYDNIEECARGNVSERCRGNYYERPPEPRTRPYRFR